LKAVPIPTSLPLPSYLTSSSSSLFETIIAVIIIERTLNTGHEFQDLTQVQQMMPYIAALAAAAATENPFSIFHTVVSSLLRF